MTEEKEEFEFERLNPYYDQQTVGILEAFSLEKTPVLTLQEIEPYVQIQERQLRRRLDKLSKTGLVGTRKPGRDRLYWLEHEVSEPVTVRYPLIGLVKRSISLQLISIGLGLGTISLIFTTLFVAVANNEDVVPFLTEDHLVAGILSTGLVGGLFLGFGLIMAGTYWFFKWLGIDIRF